jgi:signal transduction histidine kinase
MFGELNDKQDEYIRDILASGRHLLSLINDILDLSKVEAGRMDLDLDAFDLPTAVDNALTLVRERAARHGVSLDRTLDARLGEPVADERKVRQILLNLLSNAIKFTPAGGAVRVQATLTDGAVTIAVSDTGIGIAPEDQEGSSKSSARSAATRRGSTRAPGSAWPSRASSSSCTGARSGSRVR